MMKKRKKYMKKILCEIKHNNHLTCKLWVLWCLECEKGRGCGDL